MTAGRREERVALRIRPRPSRLLGVFLLSTHLLALAAVFAIPLQWYWTAALTVLVLAGLAYSAGVHLLYRVPWAVREVLWTGDGTWVLTLVSGAGAEARLLPSTYVTGKLVVLNFRRGRFRSCTLVIAADALAPDLLRRLRVRLRMEGARNGAGTDAPA